MTAIQRNTALIILWAALLFMQVLYISQRVDAYHLISLGGAQGWQSIFGYLGDVAKLLVLALFVFLLLSKDRLLQDWQALIVRLHLPSFGVLCVIQLLCFFAFLQLTIHVYSAPQEAMPVSSTQLLMWLVVGLFSTLSWLLMVAKWSRWLHYFHQSLRRITISIVVATCVWLLANFTQQYWGPLSDLTFLLSTLLLMAIDEDLIYVDLDEKLLGMGDFIVNVAPACSGYEGVGLILAFTAIYLYMYKQEFRFPRAFWLFPIGAIVIWHLNVVRIGILVMIGHYWSPDVAVGGFHSQAGWLSFIFTSFGLLWLARSSSFFRSPHIALPAEAQDEHVELKSDEADGLATATLLPIVVLLATVLFTSALSAEFTWLYPVRVIAVAIALVYCWKTLSLSWFKARSLTIAAGVLVAIVWILMLGRNPEYDASFQQQLVDAPAWLMWGWLFWRVLGSVVTVPIAEELAFRGYLLSRLGRLPIVLNGPMPLSIVAVALSSLAFGALHGAWLAGTFAGLVYAIVRLRSSTIGDAILAHAITNALIFIYAAKTGVWSVI